MQILSVYLKFLCLSCFHTRHRMMEWLQHLCWHKKIRKFFDEVFWWSFLQSSRHLIWISINKSSISLIDENSGKSLKDMSSTINLCAFRIFTQIFQSLLYSNEFQFAKAEIQLCFWQSIRIIFAYQRNNCKFTQCI